MSTFSVNIATTTEATSYPLSTYVDLDYILSLLPNNEQKLINPWDIRDSLLSLYSNSGFKQTTSSFSSIEYIGIDSLNPNDRDNKKTIFIGKRSFSGTSSYNSSHDILSAFTFSSTDTDIFFFNTKADTISNDETKIRILSSTAVSLHNSSPYIRAQKVTSTSSLSMDFVNTSLNGKIDITSDYGTVSFNNLVFPTILGSYASASNLKTLFWEDGNLVWNDIVYPPTNFIGVTGGNTLIFGNPVNINGYPLVLNDSRRMPQTINDMILGRTFSNVPITDIIKMILYPYLSPLCSIEILPPFSGGFAEIGTYPVPQVRFTITKRSLPTLPATLTNMIPGIYPAITVNGQQIESNTSTGVVITPITDAVTTFTVNVTDGTQSASASTTMQGIYPYFYGFSNLGSMTTIGLGNLNKLVEPQSDKQLFLTGTGNLYFIYDFNYGTLSNIYDWLGNTASGSFSHSTQILSSPSGLWAGKKFHIYKWTGAPQIGPPALTFQFEY